MLLSHTYSKLNTLICEAHSEPETQYLTSLKTEIPQNNNVCDTSGIYDLPCATCPLSCVGQTGRNLQQPYSEHIRYTRLKKSTIGMCQSYSTARTQIWIHTKNSDSNKPRL
jgi:hypothetical protein